MLAFVHPKPQEGRKRNKLQKRQKSPTQMKDLDAQEKPPKAHRQRFFGRCFAATKHLLNVQQKPRIVDDKTSTIAVPTDLDVQVTQQLPVIPPVPEFSSLETIFEAREEIEKALPTIESVCTIHTHNREASATTSDTISTTMSNTISSSPHSSHATSLETSNTSLATSRMIVKDSIRRALSSLALKNGFVTSFFSRFSNIQKVGQDSTLTLNTQVESVDSVDEYDDDGEPTDGEHDRRNFKSIRTITRVALEDFVLSCLYPDENERGLRTCCVTKRTEGSYNHCVFLEIQCADQADQHFVLKIPAHGTEENWQEGDAFTFRNEAVLVQHIRYHTQCPVPEIIDFDADLHNPIGAPYMLMKKMFGTCALDFWLGGKFEEMSPDACRAIADSPPTGLDCRRTHFLRSLAQAMSELQALRFNKIGTPVFEKPEDTQPGSYGPWWRWHTKLDMFALQPQRSLVSTAAFFGTGNDLTSESLQATTDPNSNSEDATRFIGAQTILNLITAAAPFNRRLMAPSIELGADAKPQKDTFVLRHDDLDLHNILVDDKGNVTGILDWDGIISVSQCVGFASIPDFLRRDYFPGDRDRAPYATWSLPRYRNIYVKAMQEACSTSDRHFTKKSMLYQAIYAMLWDHEDVSGILDIVLKEIEEFRRVDISNLCHRLGKGEPDTEDLLKDKITALLAPEL